MKERETVAMSMFVEEAVCDQSQTWTSQSDIAYFTKEGKKEQFILLPNYEDVKHIIQAKSNTVTAAKCKKDSCSKIMSVHKLRSIS